MAQVVNSQNLEQFLTTGRVDEFKPPESEKEQKPEVTTEAKADAKVDAPKGEDDDDKDLTERVRAKIGAKHRAMKEAEEFAEQQFNERKLAEKRADAAERKIAELEEKSRPAPVEAKEPKQEDFKTVQEYIEALADYKVDKKLEKDRVEREKAKQIEDANRVRTQFADRLQKAMKDHPDFEEVTSKADIDIPSHITQHILESDVGPLIGLYLARPENRKETDRILKLSPIRAIAELGKLEDRLEKKAPAKETQDSAPVSKAPAPITPIEGKETPVQKDKSKMTFQELREANRQERIAKARGH